MKVYRYFVSCASMGHALDALVCLRKHGDSLIGNRGEG
jgi:hypothetical protein